MKRQVSLILALIILVSCTILWADVTIGTGTNTQQHPVSMGYGYSRCAALYLQSEIATNMPVTDLKWYVSTASATSSPVKIYIKHSALTVLAVANWASLISDATLVYDGTAAFTETGWNNLDITDFAYNNTDNLMVLTEVNYGGTGNASYPVFRYSSTSTSYRTLTISQNNTAPTGNLSRTYNRPNVTLVGASTTIPNAAINPVPADLAENVQVTASLNWSTGGGGPTDYDVYFGTSLPGSPIANVTAATWNPGLLSFYTTYNWKVVPHNAIGYAATSQTWTFTTAIGEPVTPVPANGATGVLPSNRTLDWADVVGVGSYTINVGSYIGGTDIVNGAVCASSNYTHTEDWTYLTTYYWSVTMISQDGEYSAASQDWSFTTLHSPLAGIKTIDPAGSGADNYTTFAQAINELNSYGVGTGGVSFNVACDAIFTEVYPIPAITASGSADRMIIFQKSGEGANPLVMVMGTSANSEYIFKLSGCDFLTFDMIDVTNVDGTNMLEYGFWLTGVTGNPCSNVTIQNCNIGMDRTNTNTTRAIYAAGVATGPINNAMFDNISIYSPKQGIYFTGNSTAGSACNNNVVQNCSLNNVAEYGFYFSYNIGLEIANNTVLFATGVTSSISMCVVDGSTSTANIHNNTFSGGLSSNSIYGFNVVAGSNINIHDNTISNFTTTGYYLYPVTTGSGTTVEIHHNTISGLTSGGDIYGAYLGTVTNNSFHDNVITNLLSTGTSTWVAYGVYVASGTAVNVYNNMISDLKAPATTTVPNVRGIHVANGTAVNIYHNTVFLNASGTATNFGSAALFVNNGTIDLINNIFVNLSEPSGTGRTAAFHKNNATFTNITATTDKNIYYAGTPAANRLIFRGGTTYCPTLDEYKALIASKDQGSYTENPPFLSAVSPYNLHIDPNVTSAIDGNAVPLAAVTTDIDGDIRTATPDIGADEYTMVLPLTPPILTISDLPEGMLHLSWTPVAGANSYIIYTSSNPYDGWGLLTTVSGLVHDLAPVSAKSFYRVTSSSTPFAGN